MDGKPKAKARAVGAGLVLRVVDRGDVSRLGSTLVPLRDVYLLDAGERWLFDECCSLARAERVAEWFASVGVRVERHGPPTPAPTAAVRGAA